jgi:hypothetical protein
MSYMVMQMEELLGGVNEDTIVGTQPNRISTSKFWWPATSAQLTLGPEHLDLGDENRGNLSAPPKLIDGYAPGATLSLRAYPNLLVPLLTLAGYVPTLQQGNGTNEVQTVTVTGSPTGGTFTLTFNTEVTVPIPFNATAAQVKLALEGLRSIRPGDVKVAGTALPTGSITVTFTGRLAATNVSPITGTGSFTGGTTPAVAIAQTTAGAPGTVVDPDGAGLTAGSYLATFTKRTGAPAKTAQLIAGYPEHGTFIQGNGFGVSSIGLNAAGELTAELMGLYARRVADPALTPAFDTNRVHPIRRGDIKLDWLSGSAYSQDFSLTITNGIERGDHLGIASYYPKVLEHLGMGPKLTGSIAKRTLDPDDYDALVSAGTFAARASWVSDSEIGTSGKNYSVFVSLPACQITGGDADAQANARRFGASYEWEAAYDETAATDAAISVVCGVQNVEVFV